MAKYTYLHHSILLEDCLSFIDQPEAKLCSYLFDIYTSFKYIEERIESIYILDLYSFKSEGTKRLQQIEFELDEVKEYASVNKWDMEYESIGIPVESSKWSYRFTTKLKEFYVSDIEVAQIDDDDHFSTGYDFYKMAYRHEVAKYMQHKFLAILQDKAETIIKASPPLIVNLSHIIRDDKSEEVVRTIIQEYKGKLNKSETALLLECLFDKDLFVKRNPTGNRKLVRSFVGKLLNEELELGLKDIMIDKSSKENITRELHRKELKKEFDNRIDILLNN